MWETESVEGQCIQVWYMFLRPVSCKQQDTALWSLSKSFCSSIATGQSLSDAKGAHGLIQACNSNTLSNNSRIVFGNGILCPETALLVITDPVLEWNGPSA